MTSHEFAKRLLELPDCSHIMYKDEELGYQTVGGIAVVYDDDMLQPYIELRG